MTRSNVCACVNGRFLIAEIILSIMIFMTFQNAILPAGFRQRDQTKKSPTGPFDRFALMDFLEKQAIEHKDREDLVPFTGEKRGTTNTGFFLT